MIILLNGKGQQKVFHLLENTQLRHYLSKLHKVQGFLEAFEQYYR